MSNYDSVELLKETDKGVKMAVYSFDQLLEKINNPALKKLITESRNDHKRLEDETADLLKAMGHYEEEPSAMAKGTAWMETNMKMSLENSDRVIADIITNGCNMGAKKLYKYINQYASADLSAVNTAKNS